MTNSGAFWEDLRRDLEDPSFREEFAKASEEITTTDNELTLSERR